MNKHFNIVVFCHLYYEDSWELIMNSLNPLTDYNHKIIVNICKDLPSCNSLEAQIKKDRPDFEVLKSPNKGRDIGGKLVCLDYYLNEGYSSDFMIFLHDKRTPSRPFEAQQWRSSLFRILRRKFIVHILEMFKKYEKIGMMGSKLMMTKHLASNYESIKTLCGWYGLHHPDGRVWKKKEIEFIGGAMFWVRSVIFEELFSKYPPLEVREELEDGDTSDFYIASFTHSWERLFGLIPKCKGYKLIGV